MSDALRLTALNVAFAGVGLAVLLLAGIPLRRRWLPTAVGLAPAAGLAACGLAAALCAMTGVGVRVLPLALVVLVFLTAAAYLARRRRPGLGSLTVPRSGPVERILELVVLAVLVVLSVSIARLHAATNLDQWDGWAMWGPKAHALFADGDVWSPVFRDPAYGMQHQEYPVLLPALEALSADVLHRFDLVLIDTEAAAVLIAFGWGAWAILRLVVSPPVAAGVALALTGSARLIDNGSGNYADSVVASFTALGVLCALVWLARGSGATLVLSAVFLAAAASTKAEGLVFAVAAIAALAATARGAGLKLATVGRFGAAVLAVPALWALVDHLNGPGAENIDRATLVDPAAMRDAAGRIPTASWRLLSEIVGGWPLVSAAIVLALVAACLARLWWQTAFLALWALLAFGGLVAVFYAETAPIGWLLATSADRVVLSVVLALGASAPVLVGCAWHHVAVGPHVRADAGRAAVPGRADPSRIAP